MLPEKELLTMSRKLYRPTLIMSLRRVDTNSKNESNEELDLEYYTLQ